MTPAQEQWRKNRERGKKAALTRSLNANKRRAEQTRTAADALLEAMKQGKTVRHKHYRT